MWVVPCGRFHQTETHTNWVDSQKHFRRLHTERSNVVDYSVAMRKRPFQLHASLVNVF